jgi:hypothetical protein
MIVFPHNLVLTKYPGYYWDVQEKVLYSIKVTGNLRKMAPPVSWRNGPLGYPVSVNGRKRKLVVSYLNKLKVPNTVQMIK